MKIINREEFYKLPEGTLFQEYQQFYFGELKIKGRTIQNSQSGKNIDYTELCLGGNIKANNSDEFFEILLESEESVENIELDFDNYSRNGMFDDNQLYAVYSSDDTDNLVKTLLRK